MWQGKKITRDYTAFETASPKLGDVGHLHNWIVPIQMKSAGLVPFSITVQV